MKQIIRVHHFEQYTPEESFNVFGYERDKTDLGGCWCWTPIAVLDNEQIAEAVKRKFNGDLLGEGLQGEYEFDVKPLDFWTPSDLIDVYVNIKKLSTGEDKSFSGFNKHCMALVEAIKAISQDTDAVSSIPETIKAEHHDNKEAETLTPNTNQSEPKSVEKKIDLKNREPLEFDPLGSVIEILIQERIAAEIKLGNIIEKEHPITIVKAKDFNLSPVISKELETQIMRMESFLEYLQKAKGIIEKKANKENLALVNELIDWNSSSFAIEIPEEQPDSEQCRSMVIVHPFSYYIKKKYDALCKLHQINLRKYPFVHPEGIEFIDIPIVDDHERKTLELLLRQFENGAGQYPLIRHYVMTWPFMRRMPLPPRETINEQIKKIRSNPRGQYGRLMLFPPNSFATTKTLSHDWFDGTEESLKGLIRFHHLTQEAGRIFWNNISKTNIHGIDPLYKKAYSNIWIYALHNLRTIYVNNDGWDGLFDDESDYDDVSCREGLYTFRKCEDVFLESMMLCSMLLDSGTGTVEQKETGKPEKTIPKEIELIGHMVSELLKWANKHKFPKELGIAEEQLEKYASEPYNKNLKEYSERYVLLLCILGGDDFNRIVDWLKWHRVEIGKGIDEQRNQIIREYDDILDDPLHSNNYKLASATVLAEGYVEELAKSLQRIASMAREGENMQRSITETKYEIKPSEKSLEILSGYHIAADLAKHYGVNSEALRKQLDRQRTTRPFDKKFFIESQNSGKNEPKYLYDAKLALPFIEKLQNKKCPSNVRHKNKRK